MSARVLSFATDDDEQLVLDFFAAPGVRDLAATSRRDRRAALCRLSAWLADQGRPGLLGASTDDIAGWLASGRLAAKIETNYLTAVHSFYTWAATAGLRYDSPAPAMRVRRRPPAPPARVSPQAEAYLDHCKRRNLSLKTIDGYRRSLRSIERRLRGPLVDAGHDELLEAFDAWKTGPNGKYTNIIIARACCDWLVEEGLLAKNPATRIPTPRYGRLVPRPMPDDDFQLAWEQAKPRIKAWLALGAFAGLRCKEMAGLRVEDILDQADPPTLVVSSPKGGRQRIVPLHPHVFAALRVAGLPVSGFVFTPRDSRRQIRPESVSVYLARYLHRIGVASTAHSLRHRFATELYRATQDIRMVQELLGHASPTTTAQYTAYATGKAAGAVAMLDVPHPNRATRLECHQVVASPIAVGRDLAALLPAFRASQFAQGHTPATVDAYSRLVRQIETVLLPTPVVDATTWQLFEFLVPRCRGDRVLASYLSRLRAFYSWAVALGIIDIDPTEGLRRFFASYRTAAVAP
jgi:integrase/recombinase XerC